MTYGTDLIVAERNRQINELGWTPEHDQNHDEATLTDAAIAYLLLSHRWPELPHGRDAQDFWPWEFGERWRRTILKPRLEKLVEAGALIAAEIDRVREAGA